jgi:hypothetical protein
VTADRRRDKKKTWLRNWQARLDATPFSLFLSAALIPVGVTAAVLGSEVSRAITNVLSGDLIPHLWGALLAAGGATTLAGIGRGSWLSEYVGLRLMAFGLVFYSACCYIGLGIGGVVSGSFALAYAVACWYRSRFLFRTAKVNAAVNSSTHRADAESERAGADHVTAGEDHVQAESDSARAGIDSERARRGNDAG